ncbi:MULTISPECIES: alpha/beta hydrolase [unclassified Luteococcus]|uniref:alpha/beta hydrolase n=1 Tax=unclassified Luteococcus TaxID=2639923 RepID=UPI00313C1A48
MTRQWVDDRLLPGYECLTLHLPQAQRAPGEPTDGEALVGTLIRRKQPERGGRRALLYLHGWNDYFFQTHLADAVAGMGFDFHALELRRYGRGLADGQLPGFIADLTEYFQELDAAMEVLRADYAEICLMGHSTGGLVAALWADARPGSLSGLVLNSPWLDLQGSPLLRAVTAPVLQRLRTSYPTTVLPLPNNGLYARTIDAALGGEWSMDPRLKGDNGFLVRVGWLAAVLAGHERITEGLRIDCPVLVLISARSDFRRTWDDALNRADAVLDVEKIATKSVRLGPHLTLVRIADGLHDLALSAPAVRARYFDEIARWVAAYV